VYPNITFKPKAAIAKIIILENTNNKNDLEINNKPRREPIIKVYNAVFTILTLSLQNLSQINQKV